MESIDSTARKFSYKVTTRDADQQTYETLRYLKPGFNVEFQTTEGDPFAFGIIDTISNKHMNVTVDELNDVSLLSADDILLKVTYAAGSNLYVAHTSRIKGNSVTIDRLMSVEWNDRRQDKRYTCKVMATIDKPIFDDHGMKQVLTFTPVLIKDISLTGAYIISTQPVIGSGTLDIIESTSQISIPFSVARRGKTKNGYGIHFTELDDESACQIHQMMFKLENDLNKRHA